MRKVEASGNAQDASARSLCWRWPTRRSGPLDPFRPEPGRLPPRGRGFTCPSFRIRTEAKLIARNIVSPQYERPILDRAFGQDENSTQDGCQWGLPQTISPNLTLKACVSSNVSSCLAHDSGEEH